METFKISAQFCGEPQQPVIYSLINSKSEFTTLFLYISYEKDTKTKYIFALTHIYIINNVGCNYFLPISLIGNWHFVTP